MKSLTSAILLISLSLSVGNENKELVIEDCSPNQLDKTVIILHVKIEPYPIKLTGHVTVHAAVNVTKDIPEDCMLKVEDKKIGSLLGFEVPVTIPCLGGKMGSCTHKICDFMELHKERLDSFFEGKGEYGCPVKAGLYQQEGISVPMPDIGSFGRWIASGKYITELKLVEKHGKVLFCVRLTYLVKA